MVRPFSQICSRSRLPSVKFVRSRVPTNLSGSERVGDCLGQGIHMLSIRSGLLSVFFFVGRCDGGSFDLEDFVFGPGLLIASSSAFL